MKKKVTTSRSTGKRILGKKAQPKGDGLLIPEKIAPLVFHLRREKVLPDADLAELYGVETKTPKRKIGFHHTP